MGAEVNTATVAFEKLEVPSEGKPITVEDGALVEDDDGFLVSANEEDDDADEWQTAYLPGYPIEVEAG